jgi:hypothetical protein
MTTINSSYETIYDSESAHPEEIDKDIEILLVFGGARWGS